MRHAFSRATIVAPSRRDALIFAAAALVPSVIGGRAPAHAASVVPIFDDLDRKVASGEVPGLVALLARGDDVRVHAAGVRDLEIGRPMTRDTIFAVASIAKPLTALAVLMLVEDGVFRLDDPVDAWLPELADRRVLRDPDGDLDDTVPAARAITIRDLLTMRMGLGVVIAQGDEPPIAKRMRAHGVAPGPRLFDRDADTFMARLGSLPLIHQPGEGWLYHTGLDVAGVLVARAAGAGHGDRRGTSLGAFLRERLCGPIGMKDTGFEAPTERLATAYMRDRESGRFVEWNAASGASFAHPPAFEAGGGGYVSTVDDFHALGRFLLDGGTVGQRRLLSQELVAEMLEDQITSEQKAASPWFPEDFWETHGWGLGIAVRTAPGDARGRFGWWGGFGTAFWCDPATDTIAALFTQRMMAGADDTAIFDAFVDAAFASANGPAGDPAGRVRP